MIKHNRIKIVSGLLMLYLLTLVVTLSATGQQPQRERRAVPQASPVPSATPQSVATPGPTPLPTASPVARATSTTTKTLEELKARITEVLLKPGLAAAIVGIKVVSLDTGRTMFEENAGTLLRPASNMKIYTVAAALDRLSPDYRFNTSVYAPTRPDAAGILHGDLTIYGRGDPSIAARFSNDLFHRSKIWLRLGLGRLAMVVRCGSECVDD